MKDKISELKEQIDRLLLAYRTKKDELEWAEDDWEIGEIQEELDGYAKEIKKLKDKLKSYEKENS